MRLAGPLAMALAVAGCAEPGVTRVVEGRPTEGRFISTAAYAFFARGAAAEANGALVPALRAFEMAAAEDPGSPEIWTRLGALRCLTEPPGPLPAAAREAFDRAAAADPDHGPLYRERARCLASRGDAGAALPDAERALALDPDDLDTALVRAAVLDGSGHVEDARRALRSIAARRPASAAPWRALGAIALRTSDAALARESAERQEALAGSAPTPRAQGSLGLPRIDRALLGDDLPAARKLALQQRLPGAEVALRAAALGQRALARAQAELMLGADPADASARIALLAVADLAGDLGAMATLMRTLPRASSPPSPLGRWLFADVLRRRVGAEAALAWLGEARHTEAPGDPLLAATEARVRAALAMP